MYSTILVTLDMTQADQTIIDHVENLASIHKSQVVLLQLACGWLACADVSLLAGIDTFQPDHEYLTSVCSRFERAGISAEAILTRGNPVSEIVRWVEQRQCDLLAISSQGHPFLAEMLLRSGKSRVSREFNVPLLLFRCPH